MKQFFFFFNVIFQLAVMFHFGLSLRCVSSKIFRNMLYQARVSPEIIKSIKGIVKNNIPILLEETRAKIKELTQDSLSITIISDGWTHKGEYFTAVVIRCLFQNGSCNSFPLLINSQKRDGASIANDIFDFIKDLIPKEKLNLVHYVSDGAPVEGKTSEYLKMKRHCCICHKIQLFINKVFPNKSKIMSLAKKLQQDLESVEYKDKFKDLQQKNNPNKKYYSTIGIVATRWNTFFYCIERLVLLRDSIELLPIFIRCWNSEDLLEVFANVCKLLSPFEKLSKRFESESCPLSDVLPLLSGALIELENFTIVRQSQSVFSDFIYSIRDELLKQFKLCFPIFDETKSGFSHLEKKNETCFYLFACLLNQKTCGLEFLGFSEEKTQELIEYGWISIIKQFNIQPWGMMVKSKWNDAVNQMKKSNSIPDDPYAVWDSLGTKDLDIRRFTPIAFSILSIPPSSSEAERFFSRTGFLSKNRTNLSPSSLVDFANVSTLFQNIYPIIGQTGKCAMMKPTTNNDPGRDHGHISEKLRSIIRPREGFFQPKSTNFKDLFGTRNTREKVPLSQEHEHLDDDNGSGDEQEHGQQQEIEQDIDFGLDFERGIEIVELEESESESECEMK
eukprot:TRINITY_DN2116_c0_g1_i3.p1 TRINITY_DN2116_c0_g1~~TRINITY_DN2116_c0_g1_i3.p1  ORF type:complete len:617 (+),score=127.65 TRINITY_DN2116_c0_g1_i3:959-2809(+)